MFWLGLNINHLSKICRNRSFSWKIQTSSFPHSVTTQTTSYKTHLFCLWVQSEQAKTIISTQKSKRYSGETSAEEPGLSVFTPSCVCARVCVCAPFTRHIRAFAIGITLIYVLSLRRHFPFFSLFDWNWNQWSRNYRMWICQPTSGC